MINHGQNINAVIVSRDARLLNILLNRTSDNDADPSISVERDVFNLTSMPAADVYIYDLDLVGNDVESAIRVISDLNCIFGDKSLILIGEQKALNSVVSDANVKDKVFRTIKKPLAYRQLLLAIKSCSSRTVKYNPVAARSAQPRRFVVLCLTATIMLLVAMSFFQSDKSLFKNQNQVTNTVTQLSPAKTIGNHSVNVNHATNELQHLTEKAQAAFNEGRLIDPASDNVLFYLRNIEANDSYSAVALKMRKQLLSLLKSDFENQMAAGNTVEMKNTLSAIIELEPYNQKYSSLLWQPELEVDNGGSQQANEIINASVDEDAEKVVQNIKDSNSLTSIN